MKLNNYNITVLGGDDVTIVGDEFHYATLGDLYGLQCKYEEGSEEYTNLLKELKEIGNLFIELNKKYGGKD